LQRQDAAVARAEQRLDEARNKRVGTETARARVAAEVQRLESAVTTGLSGDETKAAQSRVAEMKAELDRSATEEQTWQAAEAEASTLLRTEQAKLGEIEDRIERLDKVLEKMGMPVK
jgi:hypothetical protein